MKSKRKLPKYRSATTTAGSATAPQSPPSLEALIKSAGPGRPVADGPPVDWALLRKFANEQFFDTTTDQPAAPRLSRNQEDRVREYIIDFSHWSDALTELLLNRQR